MGKNMNKEITLTICPNGAAVHPYEPIPPTHTIHCIGKHPQYSFTADGNGWREEMLTNINHIATVPDTPTSKLKSSMGNSKISIPPDGFLKAKQKLYRHDVLAIGPLYADLKTKSSFDDRKAHCVKKFLERHGKPEVQELIKHLIPHPNDLNKHYSSLPIKYTSESLQLLVTIDTVFIHEFLLFWSTSYLNYKPMEHDYLFTSFHNEVECNRVWRDLFLIGNQIPMSFLKKVAEISKMSVEISNEIPKNHRFGTNSLKDYLNHIVFINHPFFGSQFHHRSTQANWMQTINFLNCNHLLDCLYVSCTQPPPEPTRQLINPTKILVRGFQKSKKAEGSKKKYNRLPNASQLLKAGIRFKACEGNISVIKYNKRKFQLDLPQIVVADNTEDILRNLLAHEQTSKEGGEFCMYAFIMDSLIDTPDDLAILTKSHVIENLLGSDERLVQMWNDMCRNLGAQPCQRWEEITRDVMGHYNSHWRILYVEFCAKFFSRPWLWISLVGAFVLLVFSLVQTIYTVLGYYKA